MGINVHSLRKQLATAQSATPESATATRGAGVDQHGFRAICRLSELADSIKDGGAALSINHHGRSPSQRGRSVLQRSKTTYARPA